MFGLLQNDVASALGVFDELRSKFVPDGEFTERARVQAQPPDLRTMCMVLEEILGEEHSHVDLDVSVKISSCRCSLTHHAGRGEVHGEAACAQGH